jgi:hypothetical protein
MKSNTQAKERLDAATCSGIREDVFGWFDLPEQTIPAYDPGPQGLCPVCCWQVGKHSIDNPLKTISLAVEDPKQRDRSYFFRAHKNCWERQTEYEQNLIESSLIDQIYNHVCVTCNGTRQIQTTEWPALYTACLDCQNVKAHLTAEKGKANE